MKKNPPRSRSGSRGTAGFSKGGCYRRSGELKQLRVESTRLKQLVADLSLDKVTIQSFPVIYAEVLVAHTGFEPRTLPRPISPFRTYLPVIRTIACPAVIRVSTEIALSNHARWTPNESVFQSGRSALFRGRRLLIRFLFAVAVAALVLSLPTHMTTIGAALRRVIGFCITLALVPSIIVGLTKERTL